MTRTVQPHHPYHASEPNGAKWSPHIISKPDKIAIQSPVPQDGKSLSNAPSDSKA